MIGTEVLFLTAVSLIELLTLRFMIRANTKKSVQITDIGRHSLDLRLGQGVSNRLHNRRCIWFFRYLTPLLAPVDQFLDNVVIKLTCQTGKFPFAFSLWAVTGSAWGNVGVGNSLFVDFLSRGREFLRSLPKWRGIEGRKIFGKGRYHRRFQDMSHVEHNDVRPSVLNKGS